ncbi:hypothetical protein [Bordetella trematum]|uniref:hypothetical protein n=1 Tax=Bordetella trematum TaxID=123899 RepID=UPI000D93B99F|nr:hypothetical protein [Bordetella trematum]SPU54259.1 Uncharacterised protein [Bordetella trematum]VDH08273.1 Uncharacterised protein [Bordetella trematum]
MIRAWFVIFAVFCFGALSVSAEAGMPLSGIQAPMPHETCVGPAPVDTGCAVAAHCADHGAICSLLCAALFVIDPAVPRLPQLQARHRHVLRAPMLPVGVILPLPERPPSFVV